MSGPEEATPWYLKSYKQQFVAKDENRLLSRVETALVESLVERNKLRDTTHLHPSEMSKSDWCPRKSYYTISGALVSDPESFSLRRMNIFAEGHYIHRKWQDWMWRAGGLSGVFRCHACDYGWLDRSPMICPQCGSDDLRYREVPLRDDDYLIMGHADGEWEDDVGRALVELKSIGLGTIRWDAPALYMAYQKGDITLDGLWKLIKRPLTAHRKQINLYLYCRKLTNAIVIYEWKPTQEVKEFHLTYEVELVRPILAQAKEVVDALEDGVPPTRPHAALSKEAPFCKMCEFRTMCWKART